MILSAVSPVSLPHSGQELIFSSLYRRDAYAARALMFEAQSSNCVLAQSPRDPRVQVIFFSSLGNHRTLFL